MTDGTWPDLRVPAPKGPTAKEHLAWIQRAVRRARPANQGVIETAIVACLDGKCLPGDDSPHPGRPPPPHPHGSSVLLARVCAAELDWDGCFAALRHGEAPRDRAKAPKAAKP